MDAEVWSHADIRNGKRLFVLLAVALLAREGANVALVALSYPLVAPAVPGGPLGGLPEIVRAAFGFLLALVLLVLAYGGRNWARLSLGLVVVLTSLAIVARALPLLVEAVQTGAGPAVTLCVSLGLAVFGLVAAVLFIVLPQLRAFAWSRSTARDAIPVPADDGPAPRRALRRQPTLGERAVSALVALGQGALVLLILSLWGMVYGLDDWLRRILAS